MSATFNFEGMRVLVTGGGGGFGACIVEKFLSAGASSVIALDRDGAKLSALKEKLGPVHGPRLSTVVVDLQNWEETRKALLDRAPIHHLVNNAAVTGVAYFKEIQEKDIDNVFGVNFKPMINLGQAMVEGLKGKGEKGTIVNISSIMDEKSVPGAGLYSCTKAATTMLTKVMALELAPFSIRVNAVRPTLMATELIDTTNELGKNVGENVYKFCMERQLEKRLLTVEEAGNAVLYLSSNASEMVNATTILVDGGGSVQ